MQYNVPASEIILSITTKKVTATAKRHSGTFTACKIARPQNSAGTSLTSGIGINCTYLLIATNSATATAKSHSGTITACKIARPQKGAGTSLSHQAHPPNDGYPHGSRPFKIDGVAANWTATETKNVLENKQRGPLSRCLSARQSSANYA